MYDDDRSHERLARLVEAGLNERLGRRELIRRGLALGLGLPAVTAALAACGLQPPAEQVSLSRWRPPSAPSQAPSPTPALSASFRPAQPTATAVPGVADIRSDPSAAPSAASPQPAASGVRFALISDFGLEGEPAAAVAALVDSWAVDFVISAGDNNYPNGSAATIDRNVGQYYSHYIAPYRGEFGPGGSENRFWPVLGNHDWVVGYPEPYLSYFELPGNGRYYALERGPAAFFMLDSMPGEPDGIDATSPQAAWFQAAIAASSARWKIVVLHHSPYSSGHNGSSEWMRWPFKEWGASLVLGGHDHTYERVIVDDLTYVVNGLGGGARYARGFNAVAGSQIFFNADHGAMLIEADQTTLQARFVTRAGQQIDAFTL